MSREENYTTVVRSVVRMAHDLNLKVVAEGIETDEVAAALRQFGCDTGQGYLFGKPMLADDFEHWLKSNRQGTPRVHLLDSKRA
jgi:EAL domain-containing protein (putative c-di-GMP-specific phosphodiesterase class I)